MRAAVPATCEECGISFLAMNESVRAGLGKLCSPACTQKRATRRAAETYTRRGAASPQFKHGLYVGGGSVARVHPVAYAAHYAVCKALRHGLLVKPKTCERCGAGGRIEAHHEDYSKQLDVIWLCPKCHGAHHAVEQRERRRKAS